MLSRIIKDIKEIQKKGGEPSAIKEAVKKAIKKNLMLNLDEIKKIPGSDFELLANDEELPIDMRYFLSGLILFNPPKDFSSEEIELLHRQLLMFENILKLSWAEIFYECLQEADEIVKNRPWSEDFLIRLKGGERHHDRLLLEFLLNNLAVNGNRHADFYIRKNLSCSQEKVMKEADSLSAIRLAINLKNVAMKGRGINQSKFSSLLIESAYWVQFAIQQLVVKPDPDTLFKAEKILRELAVIAETDATKLPQIANKPFLEYLRMKEFIFFILTDCYAMLKNPEQAEKYKAELDKYDMEYREPILEARNLLNEAERILKLQKSGMRALAILIVQLNNVDATIEKVHANSRLPSSLHITRAIRDTIDKLSRLRSSVKHQKDRLFYSSTEIKEYVKKDTVVDSKAVVCRACN